MASFSFTYEDCELDLGNCSLGGDWILTIETADDGFSFKLVDADSVGSGVSKALFAVIQEWIDGDTAPRQRGAEHRSRIRARYEDAYRATDFAAEAAADRADYERDLRAA